MNNTEYFIFEDKNLSPTEFVDLMTAAGWGSRADYELSSVARSLSAYPFIGYARDRNGRLVAYLSAFSDSAFSTHIGELAVHPDMRGMGIGTALLRCVERRYAGIPIYATAFDDARDFFLKRGFRMPKRGMAVVSKRNAAAA